MPSLATQVQTLSDALVTCLRTQIAAADDSDVCWVAPIGGVTVVQDYCGCDDDGAGMAFVRLHTAWPTANFPQTYATPGDMTQTPWAVRFDVGIYRPSTGEAPSQDEALAEASQGITDLGVLQKTVACCTELARRDHFVGIYQPAGPEGACIGGVLPVTVRVS